MLLWGKRITALLRRSNKVAFAFSFLFSRRIISPIFSIEKTVEQKLNSPFVWREMNSLKKKISALQAEIDAEEKSKHSAASFLQTVKKYTNIQELTPPILNELEEKIIVYQAEGTGKGRTQRLEIHYNFVGILDTPEVACLPQSVMINTRQGIAVEYITRKAG